MTGIDSGVESDRNRSSPFYSWYVVTLLMALYVLSFTDRQIIAVMIEPIKADIGLSDIQISLVGGLSFVIFYSTAGILMGRLADRVNRPALIGVGVFFWSLTTALCGMASQFWHLLLLRMGVGLGESALLPATLSLLADYFEPRRLATAMSVFLLGAPIGIGVAFVGGGYLYGVALDFTNSIQGQGIPILGDLRAWQLVLLFLGATGMLMSLALFTVREPRQYKQIANAKESSSSAEQDTSVGDVMKYFRKNWVVMTGIYFAMACITLASYAQGFWDITFLSRTYGLEPAKGGIWYGLLQMSAGMVGVLAGGIIGDRLTGKGIKDGRLRMIIAGAAIAIPFGIVYPLMRAADTSMFMLFFTVLGNAVPYGCAAATIQIIFPARMRGMAAGIYYFTSNAFGLGIGPTAVAFITESVFGDPQSLRYSIVAVGSTARALALISILMILPHYRALIKKIE